mmetsp:Transcript_36541/g.97329  ORF Transcript_36541/g.97329 Transcript_36541/m.97329 type:complete len:210 (+) Transcript_36541:493-1122(+)
MAQTPPQHSAIASQRMPAPVGPRQHDAEELPGKHSPPHLTIPSAQCCAHPSPFSTQIPSQHSALPSQRIPAPVGPVQHESSAAPGKHSPPHLTIPEAQACAHPSPSARQTPPQHSAVGPHRMPAPVAPRQHLSQGAPCKQFPPHLNKPGPHLGAQPSPSARQMPSQHSASDAHRTPAPVGPRQQVEVSLPGKHCPPHLIKPAPHSWAQP